jgi:hypothetical protein
VDPTNHPVPLLVSLSNNSSPVDTVLFTPTIATNPAIASVVAAPPDSISMQALLNQTRDVQNEIMLNQMKHQYPLGANNLSLSDLDPSNGGHGALMGNKKAKRELHRQSYESEKLKHLDQIEHNIEHQTKQNGEAQQVFKWHKIMKLAKMLQNDHLVKKVEKEIEKMLLLSSKEDEVVNNEAPDDEPETSTMNHGGANDDDNDSIPPCPLQI